jgi:tetratricopeptide (TPR) repeat protein
MSAEQRAWLEECKAVCLDDPTSPMSRVKLGQAYEDVGDPHSALTEYRAAVQLDGSYNRAKRNVQRLETELGDSAPPAVTAPATTEETIFEKAAEASPSVAAEASGSLPAEVEMVKAEGNEFFKSKQFKEAVAAYSKAIKLMDSLEQPNAKLYTNRAAAHLGMKKYVGSAHDGQMSIDIDPTWWKGYWYRGQALTNMCRGKAASTAMAGRAELAMKAFQGALSCTTLPASKRAEIESYAENSKQQCIALNPSCSQQ